ncbi:MAG: subclass B1 metallo-beta-lactamase [Treponema sp.]|nr:subclass B1 metallo-beta-lactamase [Treponema sp.]
MRNFSIGVLIIFLGVLFGCKKTETGKEVYKSETLIINKISESSYQHTSFFGYGNSGKVSGNGMVFVNSNEAIVFDTTADDKSSAELIDWITNTLKCKIIAVIPTHYHVDNLGGLNEFHRQGIPSYSHNKTIKIAKEYDIPVPQNGFEDSMELMAGKEKCIVEYFGEGHTIDNIVGYVPSEKILFGGCLIKETGAEKGNISEANVEEWPRTVKKVKAKHPDVRIIIPGHGKTGGAELLDYTIKLFEKNR